MDEFADYLKKKCGWPVPTPEECLAGVIGNAEEAERMLRYWQAEYRKYPQGDVRLGPAHENIQKWRSDALHWRDAERFWRIKIGKLRPTQQALPLAAAAALPSRLPYRDNDLPEVEDPAQVRETGADDDDEAPAWYPPAAAGASP